MPSKLVVGYSAACKKTMSYSSKNIKYSLANVSKKAKFSLDNVFLSETYKLLFCHLPATSLLTLPHFATSSKKTNWHLRSLPLSITLTDLSGNIAFLYLPTFFESPCHDRDFLKRPGNFQRFTMSFRRISNVAKKLNVRRCSKDVWALPKLYPALISLECKQGHEVIMC